MAEYRNVANRRAVLAQAVMVFIGIGMIVVALAADWLGLGGEPGFGPSQVLLAAAGFGAVLTAIALGVKVVRQWAKRLMFSYVGLLLMAVFAGLIAAEAALGTINKIFHPQILLPQILHPQMYSLSTDVQQLIPDSNLGHRVRPHAPGHDAWGFRNDTVPDQVDVVAIGDSQTWGYNAHPSEAWPQTLARISGTSVYNMALASYGPVQYWVLTEEALKLSPKVIVIGLFFGNDLYDAYELVYRKDIHSQFRKSGSGSNLLDDTIAPRAKSIWGEGEKIRNRLRAIVPRGWTVFLAGHSAIFRLSYQRVWKPVDTELEEEYQVTKAWALHFPDQGTIYENGSVRAVFMPGYHSLALDLDEPRIAEGLRITKEMIRRIQARTDVAGVKLLVLLIPTKEMVHASAVKKWQGYLDETYSRFVQMELRVKAEMLWMCKENGIECLDPLHALEQAVERGEEIYPRTVEAHFNARGYFVLASAVHEALSRNDSFGKDSATLTGPRVTVLP